MAEEIEEETKTVNEDIGCWYYGYKMLKTTELELSSTNIFRLVSWIRQRNKINENIIKKGQVINIPKSETDIALILGFETNVTNKDLIENFNNSFSYSLISEPTYFYGTTHRPGKKNKDEVADDMIVGDKPESYFNNILDREGNKIDFANILKFKNEPDKLFSKMEGKLNNFANLNGTDQLFTEWVKLFKQQVLITNGKTSNFRIKENPILTKKVGKHEKTREIIDRIKDSLKTELIKDSIKGDIHQLLLEFKRNEKNSFYKAMHWTTDPSKDWTPNYSSKKDSFFGLRILINDVWGYDIEIENYTITEHKISGKLKIIFFDNFGLDDDDISKFGNEVFGEGFKAWYFLQHYNGYVQIFPYGKKYYEPFITQMTIYEDFDFPYE